MRFRQVWALLALALTTACSSQRPLVVGAKDGVEQQLLAEITAQFLERKLGRKIDRHLELGESRTAYQALLDGEISMYPEHSGLAVTDLLQEKANPDPAIALERARLELRRMALVEFMEPFGYESTVTLVVKASDYPGLKTVSDAASSPNKWKAGLPPWYQSRQASQPELLRYPLDLGAPYRMMQPGALFPALQMGEINMLVAQRSDPHLLSPEWKSLEDDLKTFPPAQAAMLVRNEVIAEDARVRDALQQLAGKISLQQMREMRSAVEFDERTVKEVAAQFLQSAGLE